MKFLCATAQPARLYSRGEAAYPEGHGREAPEA